MLKYTIWRLGIFFGCLLMGWLLGLRNDPALLLLVSAVVSVLLSFFLLRRQRDEFSDRIAAKLEERQRARQLAAEAADASDAPDRPGREPTDEQVEDAEIARDDPRAH